MSWPTPNPLENPIKIPSMFDSILIPITSRSSSNKTTKTAINFSSNKSLRLIILYLVEHKKSTKNFRKILSDAFTIIKDLISKDIVICDVLHRGGKPENVVCEMAKELNVDLIVLSSKDLYLLYDSQNTATKVIEIAPCPVLIVP